MHSYAWSDRQVRELARMAGLVSFADQLHYFGDSQLRQNDIQNFWSKRIGVGYRSLHGMPESQRRLMCQADCPDILVQGSRASSRLYCHTVTLWVDAEKHLVDKTPFYIRKAVRSLARFQKWLYGTRNVRAHVLRMRRARCR